MITGIVQWALRVQTHLQYLTCIALLANGKKGPTRPLFDITLAEGLSLQCPGQWTFLRFWQQVRRHSQEQLTATLQKRIHETGVADIGNAVGIVEEVLLSVRKLWNVAN